MLPVAAEAGRTRVVAAEEAEEVQERLEQTAPARLAVLVVARRQETRPPVSILPGRLVEGPVALGARLLQPPAGRFYHQALAAVVAVEVTAVVQPLVLVGVLSMEVLAEAEKELVRQQRRVVRLSTRVKEVRVV